MNMSMLEEYRNKKAKMTVKEPKNTESKSPTRSKKPPAKTKKDDTVEKPKPKKSAPKKNQQQDSESRPSKTRKSKAFTKDIFNTDNLMTKTSSVVKAKESSFPSSPQDSMILETNNDDDVYIDIQKNEHGVMDYNDFTDKTPEWALPENAKDAEQRESDHPEYDPSTLWIPPGTLEKLTPLMRQYWEIKCKNFDKILMFRIGDFFRMFYEDAVICHRELDITYLGTKMITGIPSRSLSKYSQKLIDRGYRVCVADQLENSKAAEKRRNRQTETSKDKLVLRQASRYMSKGTYIDQNDPGHEPKYLLAIKSYKNKIGLSFLELGYNTITFAWLEDDESFSFFQNLINQIRPAEVVHESRHCDPRLLNILKHSPNCPVFSPVSGTKSWSPEDLKESLAKYYKSPEDWPEALQFIFNQGDGDSKNFILSSFAGLICYLKQALIGNQVLATARYYIYDPHTFAKSRMILDSQTLQHLEVLEVGYLHGKNKQEGSLLSYIDKTVTKYGKRLMRKWISAPLVSVDAINQRLEAIEDLENNYSARDKLREELKKFRDFERMCGRIYRLSAQKDDVTYFDDIPVYHLREFKSLLEDFTAANELLVDVKQNTNFSSPLLENLTKLTLDHNESPSEMPDISEILCEIKDFIVWEGADKTVPTPKPGADQEYDAVRETIGQVSHKLNDYLEEIRARFNQDKEIRYVHIKHRYEMEIPIEHVAGSKKPKEFDFTSKRKGYERFITQKIRDLTDELEEAEYKLKNLLSVYVCFVFRYFYSKHRIWDRFICGLAQLDCLCSLSITSFQDSEIMCRPQLSPIQEEQSFINIQDLRHPCLTTRAKKFVPNDIKVGTFMASEQTNNVMLLTGPNMGGKSTILRQTCVAAILAQIGCYVPASSCIMSIVDQIFTRIGASDRLIQGKSTFYIEMEETLHIIKYATKNSLAIFDELGRGTNTFDGIALAHAVLNHMINQVQCRVLFSTHYHILVDEFETKKNVEFYHMAYHLDPKNEKVLFLYKLREGKCSKSFGLNVAKMVGIPENVIQTAKDKADEFEENLLKKKNKTEISIFNLLNTLLIHDSPINETFSKLQQLFIDKNM